ncbi:GNAT family N-acetyltransferase [Chamaesiphon polymorphus]|uniref:GNAT family N-acetyltransferase n=1 Tax=Chamaesiphon polymorphus CCALA 037 TaxID=2107692 RepID=A0A2T1G4U3_9CYAN|nr:GNAT family N-acetyltransferase [Chamaesiphon polymorphus]PSB52268.1 GNAT family N-acetyltransferase [Chamaesiphon polymorphus CCALA 037]
MSESSIEVTLREITKDNWRDIVRLKVAPYQEQFVASNAMSIAEAHFNPEVAWFRAIYAGDVPVGFLMLEDDVVRQDYFLWRFMIDDRYQGRGYGRKALELFFAHVKTRPGGDAIETSCVPAKGSPGSFYEKMGFVYTGQEENGELVMRCELRSRKGVR